jgi:RNA polymerase sigma factor (sigma-70 family)
MYRSPADVTADGLDPRRDRSKMPGKPMAQATTTLDLLERIRSGDSAAFTPLFDRNRKRLEAFIRYRMSSQLRESTDAEDLLQETHLRAFRELDRFSYGGPQSFTRWLMTIAGHVVIDAVRYKDRDKRAGEKVPFRSASQPGGVDPAVSQTPSRLLAGREQLERLFQELDLLPPNYREAILLAKVEQLPCDEIGRRLGTSRENAALILHRALKQLRRIRAGEEAE